MWNCAIVQLCNSICASAAYIAAKLLQTMTAIGKIIRNQLVNMEKGRLDKSVMNRYSKLVLWWSVLGGRLVLWYWYCELVLMWWRNTSSPFALLAQTETGRLLIKNLMSKLQLKLLKKYTWQSFTQPVSYLPSLITIASHIIHQFLQTSKDQYLFVQLFSL